MEDCGVGVVECGLVRSGLARGVFGPRAETHNDLPAVVVLVWLPVDDLDPGCKQLLPRKPQCPSYRRMGADTSSSGRE